MSKLFLIFALICLIMDSVLYYLSLDVDMGHYTMFFLIMSTCHLIRGEIAVLRKYVHEIYGIDRR